MLWSCATRSLLVALDAQLCAHSSKCQRVLAAGPGEGLAGRTAHFYLGAVRLQQRHSHGHGHLLQHHSLGLQLHQHFTISSGHYDICPGRQSVHQLFRDPERAWPHVVQQEQQAPPVQIC
mgnify:CR=1 FL=1